MRERERANERERNDGSEIAVSEQSANKHRFQEVSDIPTVFSSS